jgi:hypothetical protein
MKIVYLHQYFNTPDTTGSTRSFEMARRWVEAGHEVHAARRARYRSPIRSSKAAFGACATGTETPYRVEQP